MSCSECSSYQAPHRSATGRRLCFGCYQRHVQLAGAGTAMAGGADPGTAIATGIAAGAYSGTMSAERQAQRARQEKLAATTGFWRRLWVRIVG